MEPASAYTSRRKTARESTAVKLDQSSSGKPDIHKNDRADIPIRQLAKAGKDSKNSKTDDKEPEDPEDPTGDDMITVDDATTDDIEEPSCGMGGMNTCPTPVAGMDNSMRLLKREGIISEIPTSLCEKNRPVPDGETPKQGKNVILVVGDGMGWEMIRAGAIAKLVIKELEGLGVDIKTGAETDALAASAKAAFAGRVLNDYYIAGKGHGLSFQELPKFHVVTT
eukprot:scaffold32871_cov31-Cyclotella_meneghiniana.AAC.2